jgi:flagellar biosynthesis GTPase FlhF
MNLQTFTAPTMTECLTKVKQVMGHNVVILHTRSYTRRGWLGLVKREFVEITAGNGIGVPERRRSSPPAPNLMPVPAQPQQQARTAAMAAKFRAAAESAGVSTQAKAYIESPATGAVATGGTFRGWVGGCFAWFVMVCSEPCKRPGLQVV